MSSSTSPGPRAQSSTRGIRWWPAVLVVLLAGASLLSGTVAVVVAASVLVAALVLSRRAGSSLERLLTHDSDEQVMLRVLGLTLLVAGAAELVGINLLKSKLLAFAVSSYIVGIAGALFVFLWRGAAEPNLFDIPLSFRVLFIAIIGGLISSTFLSRIATPVMYYLTARKEEAVH